MSIQSYTQGLNEAKKELERVETQIKQLNEQRKQILKKMSKLKENMSAESSQLSPEYFEKAINFEWYQDMIEKSQSVFNVTEFRYLQKAAINATMSNIDCILIMPTGYLIALIQI